MQRDNMWDSPIHIQLTDESSTNTQPSTIRNQQTSPLLRLPAELRNKIFTFIIGGHSISVFGEDDGIARSSNSGLTYRARTYKSRKPRKHATPTTPIVSNLHLACRQIYHETSTLFFTLNEFCASPQTMVKFLKHRNTQADLITRIRIDPYDPVATPGHHAPYLSNGMRRVLRVARSLKSLGTIVITEARMAETVSYGVMLCLVAEVLDKGTRAGEIRLEVWAVAHAASVGERYARGPSRQLPQSGGEFRSSRTDHAIWLSRAMILK
ncbi:hypothetical protein C7974DRAFT_390380 [Boeremia exigua]|uniref:uncharacterized protein n=1 Tax=Boeremia exigua TaxID=749465 RepID=UPI001E8E83A8|nr:uncharacterized protein C7974DRAFT_390380 [Boeremia exigua]KAH6637851.1 hypothetical protein C7974DRAFT_390380 [Boeremia exigua]